MADTRSPSPKRRRDEDDGYDDAPPRKRSASRTPPSPSYRLAERPARHYTRDEDDRSPYHPRRYSGSTPRSRSNSHSSSRHRSYSPPRKPTSLNYKPTLILRGHKKPISIIRFSPNGQLIASASSDCTIKLWNASTGSLEHTLEGHLAGISALTWSPDSAILASGSDDKSIRLWDTNKGIAHPTALLGHHNYVYSLAFSPKGNMLVSGSYDEAVFLWDVRAARVMRSLPAHSDPVSSVDFVRDGTLIVSCSHDGLIRVWDTATGQCLRTIVHEDNAPVTCVRFSPNGKYILAWTLDSCIRLWNYIEGKGKCVKTYQGHTNKKYSLSGAFGTYGGRPEGGHEPEGGPGGQGKWRGTEGQFAFIASGDEDGAILLWDVSSKNVLQKLEGHSDAVLSVDTHPTEQVIASAGLDCKIRIWRVIDGEEARERERDERRDDAVVNGHGDGNGFVADPEILPPNSFAED